MHAGAYFYGGAKSTPAPTHRKLKLERALMAKHRSDGDQEQRALSHEPECQALTCAISCKAAELLKLAGIVMPELAKLELLEFAVAPSRKLSTPA